MSTANINDPYHLISKMFLQEKECAEIIRQNSQDLQKVTQLDYRSVEIKQINIESVPDLLSVILSANQQIFNFDLNGKIECYFARYAVDDHYDKWHMDCEPGIQTRKISFTVFLNDAYTGGDFYCMDQKIEKKKGKLIVFPSFISHKVTKITNGTRYALFGFLSGPRLK